MLLKLALYFINGLKLYYTNLNIQIKIFGEMVVWNYIKLFMVSVDHTLVSISLLVAMETELIKQIQIIQFNNNYILK